MKKALLVDGNSILNRSFYAIRNMSTKEGFPTNAIFGFFKTVDRMVTMFEPDYISIAFDLKGKNFRHEMYQEYKATRKSMLDELSVQIPVVKDIVRARGINITELQGFEADDVIGTLATSFDKLGVKTYILSGDRDLLQLVTDNVNMYYPGSKNEGVYNPERVLEVIGVTPDKITDLKGLMGDSSDNIPGIAKVGEKTALKLLNEYGDLESVLENADKVSGKKLKENIINQADIARLSKKLATIIVDAPVDFDIAKYLVDDKDTELLLEYYSKYELKNFLAEMKAEQSLSVKDEVVVSKPQSTINILKNDVSIVNAMDFTKPIYFEVIRDFENALVKKANFLAICQDLTDMVIFDEANINSVMKVLKDNAKTNKLKIKAHNSKNVMLLLRAFAIENYQVAYDYEIASYLIDPNRRNHDVADDYYRYFNNTISTLDTIYKKKSATKSGSNLNFDEIAKLFSDRILAVASTENYVIDEIKKLEMLEVYQNIDLPLAAVLVDMQVEGFKVDENVLNQIGKELDGILTKLESDIYFNAGQVFNINSPKQLGVVLFEDLGIKAGKKTKTGYSTSKDVLEKKIDAHPIIKMILEYRAYSKLKSTYVTGLKSLINKKTSKLHSYLMQTVAATGRISSVSPNLQNIPLRYEVGRKLRKAFVPSDENHVLIAADYSQIELRLLAHLSESVELIKAFNNGDDIHNLTACKVFGVEPDEVTKELRTRAKAVNFGVVYGIGGYSLSEDLAISFAEAKKYIESYFEKYPMVKDYLDCLKQLAYQNGYAETLYGRKREIPELASEKFITKQYGERIAMNSPIQGTAADIIKIAMVNLHQKMKEQDLKSKLILQIHDELIIDAHQDEVEILKELMTEVMKNSFSLSVNLDINISVGNNWYEAK